MLCVFSSAWFEALRDRNSNMYAYSRYVHIFWICVVIMLKFECWSFLCYMILKFVDVVIFLSILDLRPFSYRLISNNCCFRVLGFILVLVVEYYGNTPEGCSIFGVLHLNTNFPLIIWIVKMATCLMWTGILWLVEAQIIVECLHV